MKPLVKVSGNTIAELKEQTNAAFNALNPDLVNVRALIREFVDASSAAVSRYLPNGNTQGDKDYQYVKTDSSVNAVTIYPFGSQLVNATTSYALAAQGDCVWLAFDRASQTWWPIAV